MRNHEMLVGDHARSPYFPGQTPTPEAYDPQGTGGVTRLVIDPKSLQVQRTNLVLTGTYWNCAGGLSPWGWLSCEETSEPGHGHVFLCATDAERVQPPRKIAAYGRMRHEAATIDARTSIAYMTEDQFDGCFYRFVPHRRDRPFEGKLQALRIPARPGFDTAALPPRERLPVDWVDVDRPDTPDDSVRYGALAKGAASFRRCEGLWLAGDELFFCATIGGPIGLGQIFRLRLTEPSTLEVFVQADDVEQLDMPDNLCVGPDGLLYAAEDGFGGNFLRRIDRDGRVSAFARNAASLGEFAGPCFSPDGSTLFVNLQADGLTLAIRGPFREQAAPPPPAARSGALDWPRAARGLGTGLLVLALAALVRRRRQRSPR
jgi:secreted PhoX family phosphatase